MQQPKESGNGRSDPKYQQFLDVISGLIDEAAEKHSTGIIEMALIIRDGRIQRAKATPLAIVIE